ncbi:MAG: L-threonine 3-dehydrogenase [Elusimicrobia bacterium]|nr:L-threonine 3-dehydrogenase [Elusimicrobiota bacterium]
MRAICKTGPGPGAKLCKVDDPRPAADELLVRVRRASICGSDMAIYHWNSWAPNRFPAPMVFGHEFCGEVVEAGSATRDFAKGDFVSVESHVYCGLCYQCRNGQRHVCQRLKIIGVDCPGGFAELARVPARCAWKHPDESIAEIGSLMEPLGNAVYATLIEEVVGRSVVVLGCGPQGLFAIAVAKASGAKPIIAVEGAPYRRRLATRMGADVLIDPASADPARGVLTAAGPGGADVVLEMSGSPAAISLGLKVLRSGGRLTAFGIPPGTLAIDWASDVVFKGIRIYGVAGREIFQTWYTTERLLRTGAIDVRPVITHVFPAKDYERAFKTMASKDKRCGKVVLEF